ncbi:ABC transporter permease [Dactylosporangium sp. CA-092794]|uniref:ABC transporter permease n=1 Tax=Dactylosporangium sp. CA-092794 TaxID=3239929 RepID=UPI003D8A7A32
MPSIASAPSPALRELAYWLFRYRRTWRGTVVISIANPLLFLTAIGLGLGRLVDDGGHLHGLTYLQFIVPGLLAAAVMQTTYVEAAGPVFTSARAGGNYRAAAATPLRPADILHGHLLFMLVRVALTAVVFTAVGVGFGAVDPVRAPLVVLAALLIGCAFAPPVAAWAVTVTRPQLLTTMLRFVIMPMFMFSGTFFAVEQMPVWLRRVVECTPLWHGVELCRTLSTGTARPVPTVVHLLYLGALAAAGLVLARRNYRRALHR